MSTRHICICDRCGKEGEMTELRGGYSFMQFPKNWSTGKKDFCPKCRLAYKAHVEKFK